MLQRDLMVHSQSNTNWLAAHSLLSHSMCPRIMASQISQQHRPAAGADSDKLGISHFSVVYFVAVTFKSKRCTLHGRVTKT